ncbi:metal-dependent phosphohydrolase [Spirulina subsalsa FACHB-351]|uniref:Metal-dependent phosphohydrolase n=1 Tax=Spirulina subsalsa FACHB-351 TaxID=234711 RepID=A0ABT3L981_9CYAN|nr:Npun_R2479 family HD domain-containing metalloprotein [Spirulina subsalsa]MCW6038063.1 metal-dependent phosphohydrolase [Spirulina subsalsa FACHB-351]
MFLSTNLLIDHLVTQLNRGYHRTYGGWKSEYSEIISWAAGMALENIANSDALYHNVEHTIFVTLVGQEILRGKHIKEGGATPEDWLHFHISLLCHDIGYVKGVCQRDRPSVNLYATGVGEQMIELPTGASDAALAPYHVDRGKSFVMERFRGHKLIDAEILKENIELTRFPVPADEDHKNTENYPGLVRAADLIGQLSDPRYLQKIPALFYEFEEIGTNQFLGYQSPGDLRANYPSFYWKAVYPYIQTGLKYLNLTQTGKQVIANLYATVFQVEHEEDPREERMLAS